MYCNQCGNILPEGSVFCSFCGVKNVALNAEEEAVKVETPVEEAFPAQSAVPDQKDEAAPVEETNIQEAPALVRQEAASPVQPAQEAAPAIPQPPVMQQAVSAEQQVPRMAPNFGGAAPVKMQKPPKPVKYYTFGHIALCLCAVAVMAVVAGVFAGLYFSVR